ncbi:lipopolysaccharide biosynthesis protein [Terriglobus albidus]|uniref:lipopolysaccharide biosynthesis protein n=1 Tax=Terriglobus albidus TaxID=1592106 RepID=UPI0021E0C22B|nr:hypothetical protein [Terriglobus albidus]
MNLRRIFKTLFTNFLGQGVTIISQLIVPPLFLRSYSNGIMVYGEWIALSAAVSYLGTLNYGVQNYSNNQMSILYNSGDIEGAKNVQGAALRLLVGFFTLFAVAGLIVFVLPISSYLNLKIQSPFQNALALYLLILQIALNMLFSLMTNSYMVVGQLHRGNYWASAQRLVAIFAIALAVKMHGSFPVVAGAQLGTFFTFLILVMIDMRRNAPILLPSLRYGSMEHVRAIIKPSGHFLLIALAGFLTWQGPIIIIQRMLGPAAVATFALVRVVFQMARQILSIASSTISQDITMLFGKRDWNALHKLYDLSERVVLFLTPIVTIGSFLMCPFLFTVWLHKRNLYDPKLCFLMAIVSAVLGIKEHKTQFQSSSNKHERFAVFAVVGYLVMLGVSLPIMKLYSLTGFILCWLVWEIIQTYAVVRFNEDIFPAEYKVSLQPITRLAIFMSIAFALSFYPSKLEVNWSLWAVVGFSCVTVLLFAAAAYAYFGIGELKDLLQQRFRNRLLKTRSA